MTFDKLAYLERIGINEAIPADIAGLVTLHLAQAYSIPFENLDIMLGSGVDLTPDTLFDKLVTRRRGGYCFELNGLFLEAIRAFGFDARPLLARVHISGEPTGRSHALSLVTFGSQQWLADVGFGANGLRAPIPLAIGFKSEQDGQTFKLIKDDLYGFMLQCQVPTRKPNNGWTNLYSFDVGHVCSADIEMGNHHSSTHESSVFTKMPIVTLPKPTGRVTLRQKNLRVEDGKTVVDKDLGKLRDYHTALKSHFGLEFDTTDTNTLFERC